MPAVDVLAFVRGSLPAPPAHVLEVGAGDGELAGHLRGLGYDVLAIDPASETPAVVPVALHELQEPPQPFDAAVAVLSLHHVEPLRESCERLAALVRPGGRLVVDEFDMDRFDERAASWWIAQRTAIGKPPERGPSALVEHHREHLHGLARLREELAGGFALGEPVRGPYLHRWWVGEGLRRAEEQLIATGSLPATGARLVGIRRDRGPGDRKPI
jgi:SAM-dependent methyltransferase